MSAVDPIRKTVRVKASPESAFRMFTERMAEWWPFASHSVFKADALRLDPPAGAGSRIVEHGHGGRSCPWGEVHVWDPPRRLVFSFGAYEGWDRVTEVEVTFVPEGARTRVDLEHRGWERFGVAAATERDDYVGGWDVVFVEGFGRFAARETA
jgi:uncharacterized protein YndB with AHSA1/START domain